MTDLREDQIQRYARHILLPDVGGTGQRRLLGARVAVDVGGGQAAAAALAYLAAAGVGTIALAGPVEAGVREDEVLGGVLLAIDDIGRGRGAAMAARLRALNPDVTVELGARPDEATMALPDRAGADALIEGGAAAAKLIASIARGGR